VKDNVFLKSPRINFLDRSPSEKNSEGDFLQEFRFIPDDDSSKYNANKNKACALFLP